MHDTLQISSVPYDEPCIPVGSENYVQLSKQECRAFINQIVRELGAPPSGTALRTKGHPHDFGRYYEVEVVFDDSIEESVEYAFKVESEAPSNWDETAFLELGAEYFDHIKWASDS
jgi:hypothetical protein